MNKQSFQLKELFKTSERKSYTVIAGTALLVGLFVFFSIRPTFVKISELKKETNEKEALLIKIDKKLSDLTDLLNTERSLGNEIKFFDQIFLTKDDDALITANLDAIAQKNNVVLISVEFPENADNSFSNIINLQDSSITPRKVNISIEGDLSSFEGMVSDMENFPVTWDILTYSYSKNEFIANADETGIFMPFTASISFVYYYRSTEGGNSGTGSGSSVNQVDDTNILNINQ